MASTSARLRRPEHIAYWLRHPDSYATTLLTLALDVLGGMECLTWHPTTLRMELENAAHCELPDGNFNRLMAAATLLTTDLFWNDVPSFVTLANTLSFGPFQPDIFDPADAEECAWAVTEALLLDPPEKDQVVLAPAVRGYIEYALRNDGLLVVPRALRTVIDPDEYARGNRYDGADDPELFNLTYQYKRSVADEIDTMVEENLAELLDQLRQLPLVHRAAAHSKL